MSTLTQELNSTTSKKPKVCDNPIVLSNILSGVLNPNDFGLTMKGARKLRAQQQLTTVADGPQ